MGCDRHSDSEGHLGCVTCLAVLRAEVDRLREREGRLREALEECIERIERMQRDPNAVHADEANNRALVQARAALDPQQPSAGAEAGGTQGGVETCPPDCPGCHQTPASPGAVTLTAEELTLLAGLLDTLVRCQEFVTFHHLAPRVRACARAAAGKHGQGGIT